MFRGWIPRLGVALAAAGLLGLAAAAWLPVGVDGEVAPAATAPEGAREDGAPPEEGEPAPSWREGLAMAGGICLVAGVGLVLLAMLPSRVPR